MTKKIIPVEVDSFSPHDFDTKLIDLRDIIDQMIVRHGPTAYLNYDKYGSDPYSDSPQYNLMIEREETDDEYNLRLARVQKQEQLVAARELEEYQRLQKKFGEK